MTTPNGDKWQLLDLKGTWFPDAFIGTMNNVHCLDAGEDGRLVSGVPDALETMALVEACFEANDLEGVALKLS